MTDLPKAVNGDLSDGDEVTQEKNKAAGQEEQGAEEHEVVIEQEKQKKLVYKISENPPIHTLIIFALQQGLMPVSGGLTVTLLVTEVVCARDEAIVKTQLLSATFLMIGLSTFTMSTFGIRLPIFQGAASTYVIPLFALSNLPEWRCPSQDELTARYANMSTNTSEIFGDVLPVPHDVIYPKIQQLSGSLIVTGVIHCLIGLTGLVGFLLRFIGPITIVPSIILVGLYLYKIVVKFAETHWGVAALTAICGIVLSLYLSKRQTPLPGWNRRRGFHIKWFPLHQVFAILISIIVGWSVSAILTSLDLLSSDRESKQYYARTDTQIDAITSTPWFSFPYPGRFGVPTFHPGVFLSFFLATLLSVLDSICDYSACARMCYVPQPPAWAVNRGIAVEGLMSMLSGGMGIGHATVSYGGNIGSIGLTKVASRRVFQVVGLLYVLLAMFNKIGAAFITVPYCVLGGIQVLTIGIFIGVVLSNLQYINLSSTRNLGIIGIALLIGLMVPYWVQISSDEIQTGNRQSDRLVGMLLSNPVFVGGFLACFLDNTIPGTREDRGIGLHGSEEDLTKGDNGESEFEEGMEVYHLPWLPDWVQRSWISKIFRIFPGKSLAEESKEAEDEEVKARMIPD